MEIQERKRVIFWVRIALVLGTVVFVLSWIGGKVSNGVKKMHVQRDVPAATALGPGDVQILTTDGQMDATLSGDKILVGLSPAMVAKVKADLEKKTGPDSGLGAVIAGAVKSSVASAIGTHISYNVRDVKEVQYQNGQLKLIMNDGDTHGLQGDSKNGNKKQPAEYSKDDAARFIDAVNARKRELGIP
ncbi:MAG TPA: hypothetical protein VF483_13005 [Gemmatimonadaceae bacterium]